MATRANLKPIVRPARLKDTARIAELCGQLGYPSSCEQVDARLRAHQGAEEHAIFVGEQGQEVVGVLDVFVMRTVESEPRAEVAALVVDEKCRSCGVGQLLLERAEAWAREHGCAEIGLRSNVIRERAHRFYERQGYRVVKTQKTFRKSL